MREDGTSFIVSGSKVADFPTGVDRGSPIRGHKWPDENVIELLFAMLRIKDVVFLSQNTSEDEKGLKNLIGKRAEALLSPIQLVVLYKQGAKPSRDRESWDIYCEIVRQKIEDWIFDPIFHEELVRTSDSSLG